jgi:hypothetical protein
VNDAIARDLQGLASGGLESRAQGAPSIDRVRHRLSPPISDELVDLRVLVVECE